MNAETNEQPKDYRMPETNTVITQMDIDAASDQSDVLTKAYAVSATSTFVAKCNHDTASEKGARYGAKLAAHVFTPEVVLTARAAERTPADILSSLQTLASA